MRGSDGNSPFTICPDKSKVKNEMRRVIGGLGMMILCGGV